MRVSLVTGERVAFHSAIYGRVGKRPRTYCRHGGGILQRGSYLWIVEKNKLWQVDPSRRRRVLHARRVWRIKSPVRGSAIVATRKRIGLVPFRTDGRAHIYWFSFKHLKRPGVLDLAVRSRAAGPSSAPWRAPGCRPSSRGRRSTPAAGSISPGPRSPAASS